MKNPDAGVVIVGAGLGGLAAGIVLARAGRRVCVIDGNPHPGGTSYVYRRRGYTFPMGPLGFAAPERVGTILGGLTGEETFPGRRVGFLLDAGGLRLPISRPLDDLAFDLAGRFPADASSVRSFLDDVRFLLGAGREGKTGNTELAATPASRRLASIGDGRLRRLLGSMGTEEPYGTMGLLAAMWGLLAEQGIWHPAAGLRSLGDRLAAAFAAHGGRLLCGCPVERILVEDGRATGAVLADGRLIAASAVVSDADFKTTFGRLLPPAAVPPSWREAVTRARQSGSVLQVALGVEADRLDTSLFGDCTRVIHRRAGTAEAIDWSRPLLDPRELAGGELEVTLWSRENDALAPPGGMTVVIRTAADYAHFEPFRLGHRRRSPEYAPYKELLAAALVAEAGTLLPGLAGGVRVMDVATPLTIRDQGGRFQGAVAGWSWDAADGAAAVPRELVLTPVRGLVMAGCQAVTGLFSGGVPTALESGLRAARAILDDEGPVTEPLIPQPPG